MSKNKNRSSKYPDGTRVQTRDEFLERTNYYSPGHPNKSDLYRSAYVLDSNSNDELVLVKLTTHKGTAPKGTTSEYINIFDQYGKPIKIDNQRFAVSQRPNSSLKDPGKLKKYLFTQSKRAKTNRKLVHERVKKRK